MVTKLFPCSTQLNINIKIFGIKESSNLNKTEHENNLLTNVQMAIIADILTFYEQDKHAQLS